MRVVRAAGQNVSPSDDGRLYAQIFSDGLFTDTTFTNLGGNSIQVGAMYGDLCGRDFTIEQMTMTVILPEGEGETTGYIYVEIDTSSEDVISLNSALAPFTPTYEDINTNGAVAQMILAEYTATAVAVTGVSAVYEKAAASSVKAGSIATVESAQATENHSAGDYILLNGQMYLVTASVSVGETFVEGTNITAVSIGEELTALNAGLVVSVTRTTQTNYTEELTIDTVRCGAVVSVTGVLKCVTAYSSNPGIAIQTGLPKPKISTTLVVTCPNTAVSSAVRVVLDTNGILYARFGVAGQSYDVAFTYIVDNS